MVCYLPVTHMIFYKSDRQTLIGKDMNSDLSGSEIWISRKWNCGCHRWSWECWLPLLSWRHVHQRNLVRELTHLAERSNWDEQEECPKQSYGKNLT